jgi:hypothetical protein
MGVNDDRDFAIAKQGRGSKKLLEGRFGIVAGVSLARRDC